MSRPWSSYGGIYNGPVTMLQQARGRIQGAATSLLGPFFGPLVGSFASDYLVGQDFTKTGVLPSRFSGLLSPQSGTYANAFQQMRQRQTLRMLTTGRQQAQENLKRSFFQNYYAVTMGKSVADAQVQEQANKAFDNKISFPSILNTILDPAENKRALQGIKNTQAGLLYWQSRLNPQQQLGFKGNPNASYEAAKEVGAAMTKMVTDANLWMVGAGKGEGFGGFNGASVSQLASIMQNASNQIDPAHLTDSIERFKAKVQATASALAPLKDIFGEDIKAMTDMLQSVTGQNINQLSPAMIKSIATNTVDMARYSGATIAQIAGAGQKLFQQTASYGGNSFSRIGGSLLGAYYSGLIAQGNAPAGVHAAQYAGNTQRALASAQASSGVDRTAMAFGLWQEQEGNRGKSIDQFMAQVMSNRGSSGSMMQAVLKTVNKNAKTPYTEQSLVRGLATTGYRTSLQSGRLAQLGVSQQYQIKLADAISNLRAANLGEGQVADAELKALGAYMSDANNAAAIKELMTNANDKKFVENFARGKNFSAKAVNFLLNRGNIMQQATRWSTDIQLAAFRQSQNQIRKQLDPLDKMGTGAYQTFWNALSGAPGTNAVLDKDGSLRIGKNKISAVAVRAQTRSLLGANTQEQIKAGIDKLKAAFGDQFTQIMTLATGDRASDKTYVDLIRGISTGKIKKDTKQYDNAIAQISARKAGYIASNISQSNFKSEDAKQIYKKALDRYKQADTQQAKKQRGKQLSQALSRASRLQKIDSAQTSLSEDSKKAFKQLIKTNNQAQLKQLFYKSDADLDKTLKNKGITAAQFKEAYRASAFDRRASFQSQLVTLLRSIWEWMQKHTK